MDTRIELLMGLVLIAIAMLVSFFCPEWGVAALTLLKGVVIIAIAGVGIFITIVSLLSIKGGVRRRVRY